MIKRKLVILGICIFGSSGFVILLFIISNKLAQSPNHFIRQTTAHSVEGISCLDTKQTHLYFMGIDKKEDVYLGNREQKNRVLKARFNKSDNVLITETALFDKELQIYNDSYLTIDSNKIFLFEGYKSEIWSGKISDLKLSTKIQTKRFATGISIDTGSFIFVRINRNNENELVRYGAVNLGFVGKNLLQKQIDGLFCTDGQLIKVPNSNKIFYTYFYRNQFICADTNLNLLYRGKTIDTNTFAKIKIAKITSANQLTLASPPVTVNNQTTANEKYLFIHSGLKADNETANMHEEGAAIDVYNVSDGKYKLSFYLPDFNGKKLTDFRVYGQSLYALYDHYLYKYQLNF
ncbi:hypothetical protein [Pedobacter sp.]|jgi:hypothetical protein|uniref:hypothetical protein n=1 Tax=Pedobacter sp. TaxID=1411316 RepID=UPI002C57E0AE|nr:hypothetical protein [Pedobacter sp.]HWW42276.1 hypothetical protein [Pedobacter sp.]